MADLIVHKFLNGSDDDRYLELLEAGTNLAEASYAALTSVEVTLRSSAGVDTTVDTTGTAVAINSAEQRIDLELGKAGLTAGTYRGRVIAYSPDQPLGVMFLDFGGYLVEILA